MVQLGTTIDLGAVAVGVAVGGSKPFASFTAVV
jgi:hypothetical protein